MKKFENYKVIVSYSFMALMTLWISLRKRYLLLITMQAWRMFSSWYILRVVLVSEMPEMVIRFVCFFVKSDLIIFKRSLYIPKTLSDCVSLLAGGFKKQTLAVIIPLKISHPHSYKYNCLLYCTLLTPTNH